MYKAVFLDLDNTLLDFEKNISKENENALKYVTEKGGLVCIASGRQIESTKQYWQKLDSFSRYIIYSNGAGIYDAENNESIFTADIDKNICLELNRYCEENNICIRVDTPYGRFISKEKYQIGQDIVEAGDMEKIILENPVLQLSFLSTEEEKNIKMLTYINEKIDKSVKVEDIFKTGYSNEFFAINIINTNVSKGNAISGLCKFLKIDLSEVIAIGDGLNDISMIKTVGLGVAMENASQEVKNVAKEITGNCNESGVAKLLMSKF